MSSKLRDLNSSLILYPSYFLKFRRRDFFDDKGFDFVLDLNVVEIDKADTAFKALTNFVSVFLKAFERGNIAFPDNDAVADEPRARLTTNQAVRDAAARNRADFRNAEDFLHERFAENDFLLDGVEH